MRNNAKKESESFSDLTFTDESEEEQKQVPKNLKVIKYVSL